MKGNPFGYFPREKCPWCSSWLETYPVAIVTFETQAVYMEWLCMSCGMFFRTAIMPRDLPNEVTRQVLTFEGPRPKTTVKLAELKLYDLDLYKGWKDVATELIDQINRQINEKKASNRATHFLRMVKVFARLIHRCATTRLGEIDRWFREHPRS